MDNKMDCTGAPMDKLLTDSTLLKESQSYHGTGGASQGNGKFGFIPAFMDTAQGKIYLSRYSDGRLAKVHILDGMPDHLIVSREDGHVKSILESVVAGFVLNDVFFTRDEAAQFVAEKMSNTCLVL